MIARGRAAANSGSEPCAGAPSGSSKREPDRGTPADLRRVPTSGPRIICYVKWGRRWLQALLALAVLVVASVPIHAQDTGVPIPLQVELLARLLWYERGLQKSPQGELRAVIIERARDPASGLAAAQLAAQLGQVKTLGGKRVSQRRVVFESAEQVGRVVQEERAYLACLTPGLSAVAADLARVLAARGVLSVSTQGADTGQGIVLGFELASGKPRIVLNLARARAQKLDFSAQFLRVVRVVP
jgi:hypothetical protein